ncbi:MAG: heterodisulfide reductase-related iron-sulfur binding cluster [Myxococcota bacterium]|nr:heterodisulfide reductase-related iron-sulfur binding cluster [Myxococcota bacterium]MDW8362975.1 heterodisulfide reductase-related iron-sulfur binding cluster [Myxococcales bacterium]
MTPEKTPALDPNDPRYWDPRDLEAELRRVFSICHGCRMCVGYCPAFPELFARIDEHVRRGKGEAEALDDRDFQAVDALCFQCKLCYFKCPYTPDDGHPWHVDFPRLMLRHRAQRARRDGIPIQDRVLGEPQWLGRAGSGPAAPLANLVSASRLVRKVQERLTGISADFPQPPFAREPFPTWWRRREPAVVAPVRGEVALFSTCTANFHMPATAIAAVRLFEAHGWRVHWPAGQTCCGMPNLDGGNVDAARDKARRNVEALLPHVDAGRMVVVPGPTCSYVLRREYPELVGTEAARRVAAATHDLMELVRGAVRRKQIDLRPVRSLGRVGYHAACHLRAQKFGFPAAQLLERAPETTVTVVEQCSAVDGTWGMKAQYYELGRRYARKLVASMEGEGRFDWIASDCPLSALRLEHELGRPVRHPIQLLAYACGLETADGSDANGAGRGREDERTDAAD